MLKPLFLLLCMGLSGLVYSQNLDSLTNKLQTTTGKERSEVLDELAVQLLKVDAARSLEYARENHALVTSLDDEVLQYQAEYTLCRVLEINGQYEEALAYTDAALSKTTDSLKVSAVYHMKGVIYESMSQYEKSLEAHLRALKIREYLDDTERIIMSVNSLSFVYKAMGQYEKAIAMLEKNKELCASIGDNKGLHRAEFNIALMTMEMDKHAEAIPLFRKAVSELTETDEPLVFSYYYNNIANCFEKLLHVNAAYYDSALYYGHKSLAIKQRLNNWRGIANSHNQLAATYERASDYENCYKHATEALRIADSLHLLPIKKNALNYLISAELGLNQTEKTNDHFIAFTKLSEQLTEESYSQTLSEMATKYETEKKESENARLREEADQQKQISILLTILAIVLLTGTGLLSYFFLEIKKINRQLAKDKEIIEEQSETLRELNLLKSNFFASISHELRTPLTLIQGHSDEILKLSKLPVSASEPLRKIKRNIHQLSVMVNDLLDLSKLELQERQVNIVPTDVLVLLKRICGAFTSLAESKHLTFRFTSNQEGAVVTRIDQLQFEKVMNNLIYNAFRFSKANGSISVYLTRTVEGVIIEVSDTGVGIPKEDMPYIFDRFFKPKGQMPNSFGSGMGLAIAKELTELMGGEIEVNSEEGKGSVFRVILPPSDEEPVKAVPQEVVMENEEIDPQLELMEIPSDTTVLIVEDNNDLRDYLIRILRDHFNIIPAANGQEALDLLKTHRPDLILTDVMMPVMNGWELIENLQKRPNLAQIPVIVLTAVAESQDRVKGLRMGVDDYIVKPFETEELLIRMTNVVMNLRERIRWAREFQDEPEEDKKDLVEGHDLVMKIKEYVLERIDDRALNVTQIAMHLGLSERQLYRKSSELVGMSPSKLVQEVKLIYARELLLSQRFDKLNQIASAVGFDSTRHFSKLYSERFGKKPSDYFS